MQGRLDCYCCTATKVGKACYCVCSYALSCCPCVLRLLCCHAGRNWGDVEINSSSLLYRVDQKVLFEVPLPEVSQAQQTKVCAHQGGFVWCGGRGGTALTLSASSRGCDGS
jgi:hypothetical protein